MGVIITTRKLKIQLDEVESALAGARVRRVVISAGYNQAKGKGEVSHIIYSSKRFRKYVFVEIHHRPKIRLECFTRSVRHHVETKIYLLIPSQPMAKNVLKTNRKAMATP